MEYKYESEAMQVLHEEWLDMHRSGIVSDARLREIEEIIFGEEDETEPKAENFAKEEPVTA
ncbi:MAG: hypothetical protein LBQ94_08150 [Treponema sp.]|jgi:hypothetical protein|nr:hypothetical protein [Treponema sp.]